MVTLYNKIVNSLLEIKFLRKRLPRRIVTVGIPRQESQRLNLIYRRKNKPASVLSFLYSSDYGEILICPEVVRREAKEQGNSYKYQMTWMVIHGMLHLAGLHHEKSKTLAARFSKLESKILQKLWQET